MNRNFYKVIADFIILTKPRIIELLLVATIPVMLLAQRGNIPLMNIINTFFAGWLGAGSANAFNMVLDRDIDKKMQRTELRPIAAGRISPKQAIWFATILGIISIFWLALFVNIFAAALVLFAILFYVLGYTLFLKRNTTQNVVWGGIAGCMPVLVGWVAVKNSISIIPFVLFLIIFFWTPPHSWALAIRYEADYQNAEIPMLPVMRSNQMVVNRIIKYIWVMVVFSLSLIFATGYIYAVVVLLADIWIIYRSYKLKYADNDAIKTEGFVFFLVTNWYLSLVFTALAVDSVFALPLVVNSLF